ncbi:MAG: hypothetical protein ACT4P6_16405 [Gemmatimonadaceae bacterium]
MEEFSGMVLRRLGETADGLRDDDLTLVANTHSGELEIITKTDFEADQRRPPPRYVLIRHIPNRKREPFAEFARLDFVDKNEKVVGHCCPPADALFWTDSSFEKFLYPYYEQVRIFPEENLKLLKQDLRDPAKRKFILAVRHDSPSNPVIIKHNNPKCDGPYGGGPYYLVPAFKRFDSDPGWFTPEEFRKIFDERRKVGGT